MMFKCLYNPGEELYCLSLTAHESRQHHMLIWLADEPNANGEILALKRGDATLRRIVRRKYIAKGARRRNAERPQRFNVVPSQRGSHWHDECEGADVGESYRWESLI